MISSGYTDCKLPATHGSGNDTEVVILTSTGELLIPTDDGDVDAVMLGIEVLTLGAAYVLVTIATAHAVAEAIAALLYGQLEVTRAGAASCDDEPLPATVTVGPDGAGGVCLGLQEPEWALAAALDSEAAAQLSAVLAGIGITEGDTEDA